ncbi:hypothetical protein BDQ12DRAFT_736884 [Crucibulum laeve]|uniref:Uncharacterized protein n=1 Tax=Crucibulum laeve TaxID=68775 RepID=A0A5C3LW04_9AGAR|nr:hypothetical protein BDQ12DRAFT_736884 [Crucibulum laeve]
MEIDLALRLPSNTPYSSITPLTRVCSQNRCGTILNSGYSMTNMCEKCLARRKAHEFIGPKCNSRDTSSMDMSTAALSMSWVDMSGPVNMDTGAKQNMNGYGPFFQTRQQQPPVQVTPSQLPRQVPIPIWKATMVIPQSIPTPTSPTHDLSSHFNSHGEPVPTPARQPPQSLTSVSQTQTSVSTTRPMVPMGNILSYPDSSRSQTTAGLCATYRCGAIMPEHMPGDKCQRCCIRTLASHASNSKISDQRVERKSGKERQSNDRSDNSLAAALNRAAAANIYTPVAPLVPQLEVNAEPEDEMDLASFVMFAISDTTMDEDEFDEDVDIDLEFCYPDEAKPKVPAPVAIPRKCAPVKLRPSLSTSADVSRAPQMIPSQQPIQPIPRSHYEPADNTPSPSNTLRLCSLPNCTGIIPPDSNALRCFSCVRNSWKSRTVWTAPVAIEAPIPLPRRVSKVEKEKKVVKWADQAGENDREDKNIGGTKSKPKERLMLRIPKRGKKANTGSPGATQSLTQETPVIEGDAVQVPEPYTSSNDASPAGIVVKAANVYDTTTATVAVDHSNMDVDDPTPVVAGFTGGEDGSVSTSSAQADVVQLASTNGSCPSPKIFSKTNDGPPSQSSTGDDTTLSMPIDTQSGSEDVLQLLSTKHFNEASVSNGSEPTSLPNIDSLDTSTGPESVSGWDTDLTQLSDSLDEGECEINASSEPEQESQPTRTGLKICIPARSQSSSGHKCSIKKCNQIMPPGYHWKCCVMCRARTREYQRKRQNLKGRHTRLDVEMEKLQSGVPVNELYSLSEPASEVMLVPDEGSVVSGARVCSIRACGHIIPHPQEYRWKMCGGCRERTRERRRRKEVKSRLEAGLPPIEDRNSDNDIHSGRLNAMVNPIPGRCSSSDCGMLVDPSSESKECEQCIARRNGLAWKPTRLKSRKRNIKPPSDNVLTTRNISVVKRHGPSPYPEYKSSLALLYDFQLRLSGFLEAQSYYFLCKSNGLVSNVSGASVFGFDGEYSTVAMDFDIAKRREKVVLRILRVKESMERTGQLRFAPDKWVATVDDGIVTRFKCIHQAPILQQDTQSVGKQTYAVKNMQGELEITVLADHSHQFLPGQRTIVRFRLVG